MDAQVQQKVAQVGECRSDFEIINELAKRVGLGNLFWDGEEQFLDDVLTPLGIHFEEFRKVGILTQSKQYRLYRKKGFPTSSGKVHLYAESLKKQGLESLPGYRPIPESPDSDTDVDRAYPLLFTTWKSSPYRHSGGRQIASLRGSHPEAQVLIHPETARSLAIEEGDWVAIETKRGRIRQRARLSEDLDPRVVGLDYGWWYPEKGIEGHFGWDESNVNLLTDDGPPFSPEMGSSNLRGISCIIYKVSTET
jgi:anaerobic selenocysteine-containing dehydrogenase